jgi:hypothetical protein
MKLMIIMIIEIMYTCHLFPSVYLSAKLIIIISVTLGYLEKMAQSIVQNFLLIIFVDINYSGEKFVK